MTAGLKSYGMFTRVIFCIIAAFYAYGALVHVLNMLSLTGFAWMQAPVKWRVLDIVYFIIDVTVVTGLLMGRVFGLVAFFLAAFSQIILYTLFRDWILDVPEAFAPSADQVSYLDTLVAFHVVTIILMTMALWLERRKAHTS